MKSIPAFFYRNNLSKLAKLYGTDKFEHGYTEIYEKYFCAIRKQKLSILEIGIGGGEDQTRGGNSLKMWAKYFPNSSILGIDIYNKSLIDYRRISTYQGDQKDKDFLSQFDNLDIIIDDGGHINSDIIQSFEILYPKLNKCGFYIVEDCQVSSHPDFHNPKFPSTIDYFKSLKSKYRIDFWEKLIIFKT